MAGNTMRFRNPAGHAGLLNNLLALVNGLAGFLGSRLALFAKESRTALAQILVLLACVAGAVVLALFGYVFLIASAIAALAESLQISWIWIALAAAGVHFLLALICLLIARSRMKKAMFEATAAELKKDREWLKNLDKKSLSSN
jgi:uncharacterized membrane protein YqjE